MPRRKLKTPTRKPVPRPAFRDNAPTLRVQNPHAAGIDVHSDNHVVCVGPGQVLTFGPYTADLHAITDYLRQAGVTTVALESTGVYWIPLFEHLEAQGFACHLIEPGQLHGCGARPKTDVLDCQWMQRLHTYGLLKPSFRPPESVRALRAYHRQRQMVIRHAAAHVQHMQKALEQMNVKLTEVLSDITGLTGLRIIRAILAGERDPHTLAGLASPKCAKTRAEFALALRGLWQPEHLFELQQAHDLFVTYQRLLGECDRQIEAELAKQPNRAGDKPVPHKPRRCGRKKNDLRFAATGPLFRALGVDLTEIEGIDVGTALVILAELGVDVSRFPTEKQFASWLGLCPNTSRSNLREKRRSPRQGASRLKQALRMCAQSVGRTQTPLGMFYRRIKSRIGGMGACTATAHKLARLVYRMLKYGRDYVKQGMDEYAAKMQVSAERVLRKKAAALGFELTPRTAAATT
ncbi:MAG TPA: IS110 family transposase [Gemmataceae bacterium]|nr:IS110 family transposase [Gemmataceae bacterium]